MSAHRAPFALTLAFVLVYWALAGLGRDLFFNYNVDADLADDKIGAVLPYIRAAACVFAALAVVNASGLGWALSRLPLALAPFCLWTLSTAFWTDSVKDTLRGSLTLLAAWGAVPILQHRLGAVRSARLLLHFLVAVCVASLLVAIFLPSVGRHSAADLAQGAHDGRWRGIFSHKNGLGPWAAYGTVLPLLYGGIGMRWPIRIAGSACALACLIFSGSATSMAVAGICLGLHVAFRALRSWPTGMALLLVPGAAIVGGAVATLFSERLLAILGRSESLSGRGAIWRFAWEYVVDNPWLGYGYATLGGGDLRAREANLFAQAIPGPESGYFDLLLETGLVGSALFLGAYVVCAAKGLAWLKRSAPADMRAMELYLTIFISTLAEAVTESNAFVVTGYDGVIFFAAFFALSTAPWPSRVARRAPRQGQVRQRQDGGEGALPKCGTDTATANDNSRRHLSTKC